jgi:hypothetical protein
MVFDCSNTGIAHGAWVDGCARFSSVGLDIGMVQPPVWVLPNVWWSHCFRILNWIRPKGLIMKVYELWQLYRGTVYSSSRNLLLTNSMEQSPSWEANSLFLIIVGIATRLQSGWSVFWVSIPGGGWNFFPPPPRPERLWGLLTTI